MTKIKIFGQVGYIVTDRKEVILSKFKYIYPMRHSEADWTLPISIEKRVAANFFGKMVFEEEPIISFLFNNNYYELSKDEIDLIEEAIYEDKYV